MKPNRFPVSLYSLKRSLPHLLVLSIILTEIATGLYTPTLPLISIYFGVTEEAIAPTLSLNLLGIALSGPFYGPLSDRFGRRKTLLGGIFLFTVGSFLCLLPSNLSFLIIARFIQGLGAGVAGVLSMAMVKDIFRREECAEAFSTMDMYIVLAPAFSPILGGYIAENHGWRLNFYVILIGALITLFILFLFLPETLSSKKRSPLSVSHLTKTYLSLLQNQFFVGNAIVSGLVFGGFWAFLAASPYLLIERFGFSVFEFSIYTAWGVLAYVIGAWLNKKYIRKKGIPFFLSCGLWGMFLSGISMILVAFFLPDSPFWIRITTCFYLGFTAFVFPNTGTRAMEIFPAYSGFASALLITFEMGISSLSAELACWLYENSFMPLALLMFAEVFISFALFLYLEKKQKSSLS